MFSAPSFHTFVVPKCYFLTSTHSPVKNESIYHVLSIPTNLHKPFLNSVSSLLQLESHPTSQLEKPIHFHLK